MSELGEKLKTQIAKDFSDQMERSTIVKQYKRAVEKGTATLADAQRYSSELGRMLGNALEWNLRLDDVGGRLDWGVATSTIYAFLKDNYGLVNVAAIEVQALVDAAQNIHLKAVQAEFPEDRVKGIMDYATSETIDQTELSKVLKENPRNCTESFFDDFIQANATARQELGLSVSVVRKLAGRACKWCSNLAGVYEYSKAPPDVYKRHTSCRCSVTYISDRKRVNVWTKKNV